MNKSPDAFRTISEVAEWLGTPAHVFRFWESRFLQIKPVKRAGGRRYYRPADMLLLGGIKKLLHDGGMTIKGVQKILREKGIKHVQSLSQPVSLQVAIKKKSKAASKPAAPAVPPKAEPVAQDLSMSVAQPKVRIKPKISEPAVVETEAPDMFDLPLSAGADEATLRVIQFPQSLKTASDLSLKDAEDIEALYYSLKMVRNNMMHTAASQ